MNRVWDLCKLMNNPKKVRLIHLVCDAGMDGIMVKALVASMKEDGLKNSGISQYLKQAANLGIVRRERKGNEVYYFYDTYRARDEVKEIMEMIRARSAIGGSLEFLKAFRTLMNPFRAKLAHYLSEGRPGDVGTICKTFSCSQAQLFMAVEIGVEDGMFIYSNCAYSLTPQTDDVVCRIIALSDFRPVEDIKGT